MEGHGESRPLPTTVPGEESAEALSPGDSIGRFLVLGKLGAGGMGVVYAAYDADLERKVAIKLLRGSRALGMTTRGGARLMAEAQAMARLSHPNIVTVHELAFSDDTAFLVMEHVAGPTLRDWLAERERSTAEVLAMFVGAGEGLAAAHRDGIVHRDFKPDNVLIDRDGRPRVVDFGIAASLTEDAPRAPCAAAGTPPYMAPEQLRGEPCDAGVDQFAYCVSLWEAVYGSRPFDGATRDERLRAIAERRLCEPTRRAPDWLRAVLLRGMLPAPEARWQSLDALLRELRRDPGVARRRAAGAVAIAGLAAAVWLVARPEVAADPCAGAAGRLAGVWDEPRKQAVHAAFAASHVVYADDTWRRVESRLDGYTADWVAMAGATCRATRVDGRQSDTLMDLRMACLDDDRAVLAALTALWARGMDGDAVEHAVVAVLRLAPVAGCSERRMPSEREPAPADPVRASQIAAVRTELDAVRALDIAQRWTDARPRAAALRGRADATGWAPLRAEAAYLEGDVLSWLEDPQAQPLLIDAVRLAGAAHDDRLAARALIALISHVAEDHQQPDRALDLADVADAWVARAGNDDALRGALLAARGEALLLAARYDAARTALVDARALLTRISGAAGFATLSVVGDLARLAQATGDFATAVELGNEVLQVSIAQLGPRHPRVASLLNNLGLVSDTAGDNDAAASYYRRSLDIKLEVLGPDSAPTALAYNNLGSAELARGNVREAENLLDRALAIRERVLGPDHAFVATTLGNLAHVRRKQGRYAEALALLQRALAIKTKAYGPDHDSLAYTLEELVAVHRARGDAAAELDAGRRELAIRDKALGHGHLQTLRAMTEVGHALASLHRCGEARPLLAAAIAGLEATGKRPADLAEALATRAACDLGDGGSAAPRAISDVERSLALEAAAGTSIAPHGAYRWLLARALWANGRRDAARAAAHQAERELAGDADGADEYRALQAWLVARAG